MTRAARFALGTAVLAWWTPTLLVHAAARLAGFGWSWVDIARASRLISRANRLTDADRPEDAQALLDEAETLLDRLDPAWRERT